jgi:acyl-CoA reductase-like NAD-dependent aldehyde dehydrogenase
MFDSARQILSKERDKFLNTLVQEAGKPIKVAEGEVDATIERMRLTLEEANVTRGDYIPGDWVMDTIGKFALVIRQPRGVIAAIGPFNYPLFIMSAKLTPALVSGNTVIAKPSSKTPLSFLMLSRVLERAGIPAGCLNVVTGTGGTIGDLFPKNEKIDMITFTGSTEVGHHIAEVQSMKKLHLELGGKAAAIVLGDANLDLAAIEVAKGGLKFSGQRCDGIDRVLIESEIADEFVLKLLEEIEKNYSKLGDPKEPGTQLGPLIDDRAVKRVDALVKDAIEKGAKLLTGGKYENLFYYPTVLDNVTEDMDVAWVESFGPILPIIKIKNIEGGIELANKSDYGLDSCIFTDDIYKAIGAGKRLQDGEVTINAAPGHGVGNFPFGGNKDSGMGREGIGYSIDEMTKIHTIVFQLPPIQKPFG